MTQLETSTKLEGPNFTLDLETQELTYHIDRDTGETQTARLHEVVEFVMWMKSREADIRHMIQKAYPATYKKLMKKVGNFYKGVDEDRQKVKVSLEAWNAEATAREKLLRKAWLDNINLNREGRFEIELLDTSGRPLPNPNKPETYDESDCPGYIIQEGLAKMLEPQYWIIRGQNLDAGRFVRVASDY